jgi:DNA-binding IclR family transcriptional regulator
MKTAGLSVGTDQIFIDAFNGLLASQSEVFTFLDELVSAGIIKADGKERWRWSYQIFRNGFAALGADNGVNTL